MFCGSVEFSWERLLSLCEFLIKSGWSSALPEIENPWNSERGRSHFAIKSFLHFRQIRSHAEERLGRNSLFKRRRRLQQCLNILPKRLQLQQCLNILPRRLREHFNSLRINMTLLWYVSFRQALVMGATMSFGELKDHIYGISGVMLDLLPPGVDFPVGIEYESPVQEVFTDATARILENTMSLILLEMLQHESSYTGPVDGWPSWVPNYPNGEVWTDVLVASVWTMNDVNPDFDAKRRSLLRRPTVTNGVLTLHGHVVEIVEQTYSKPQEDGPSLACFILKYCKEASAYPSGNSRTEAMWRTLLGGTIPWTIPESGFPNLFRSWLLLIATMEYQVGRRRRIFEAKRFLQEVSLDLSGPSGPLDPPFGPTLTALIAMPVDSILYLAFIHLHLLLCYTLDCLF